MNEPIREREALWDKFLQLWPLEQLPKMTRRFNVDPFGADLPQSNFQAHISLRYLYLWTYGRH